MDSFFMDCEERLLGGNTLNDEYELIPVRELYNFTQQEIIKSKKNRIHNVNWMKAIMKETEISKHIINKYVKWVKEGGGDFYFDD